MHQCWPEPVDEAHGYLTSNCRRSTHGSCATGSVFDPHSNAYACPLLLSQRLAVVRASRALHSAAVRACDMLQSCGDMPLIPWWSHPVYPTYLLVIIPVAKVRMLSCPPHKESCLQFLLMLLLLLPISGPDSVTIVSLTETPWQAHLCQHKASAPTSQSRHTPCDPSGCSPCQHQQYCCCCC